MPCLLNLLPKHCTQMCLPVDIAGLYTSGTPFAIYRFPGDSAFHVAGGGAVPGRSFRIVPWLADAAGAVDVARALPELSSCGPWRVSTPRDEYMATTEALIGSLKERGGKCVRMRTICSPDGVRLDINGAVAALFGRYPDAFCHCYYTPRTGLWAGATPELLAEIGGGEMRTMSLAGTRRRGVPQPWDSKNRKEQAMVTDFIVDTLRSLGLEVRQGRPETLAYGSIEHICTRISAGLTEDVAPSAILDALSPTPAVAGYPRAAALAEIQKAESAPRRCYAGYVAVDDAEGKLRAYVNLRCAQLSADGWCVYAGGGITPDSDASDEWAETEAKAAPLVSILQDNTLSL